MTYFADETPYEYGDQLSPGLTVQVMRNGRIMDLDPEPNEPPDPSVQNIGWLDDQHEFNRGPAPAGFTDALHRCALRPVQLTRGLHRCQLCGGSPFEQHVARYHDLELGLGNGEIRVRGTDGVEFAAPTLVVHYVVEHQYLPPAPFVDAVCERAKQIHVVYGDVLDALRALGPDGQYNLCIELLRGLVVPRFPRPLLESMVEGLIAMRHCVDPKERHICSRRWDEAYPAKPYAADMDDLEVRFRRLRKCLQFFMSPRTQSDEDKAGYAARVLECIYELGGPRPADAIEAFAAKGR